MYTKKRKIKIKAILTKSIRKKKIYKCMIQIQKTYKIIKIISFKMKVKMNNLKIKMIYKSMKIVKK